jgi:hypothetical protein
MYFSSMTRSPALEQKLTKHIQTKAWKALLVEIKDLDAIEFDVSDPDLSSVDARARETWLIAAIPDALLRDFYDARSNADVVQAWTADMLRDSGLAEAIGSRAFYLRADTYYAAGWTKVQSVNFLSAIPSLYTRLTHRAITIATADLRKAIVLRPTEHFWHAYWTWPVRMQD